ncbi:MAG: hypothetical protein U0470_12350 [Anaerolineae bacterium]
MGTTRPGGAARSRLVYLINSPTAADDRPRLREHDRLADLLGHGR